MLPPIDREIRRSGTGRHHDRTRGDQHRVSHCDLRRADEPCRGLKRHDPATCQPRLELLRVWIGECPLESDQLAPINRQAVGPHTLPREEMRRIDRGGSAHQDLFRIAAPESACAAERALVDHRDRPSGGATSRGDRLRGGTRADHDEVERLSHDSNR